MLIEALISLSVFFLIMAAAQFLLGMYGKLCSNILNFPIWYFVLYEVPAESYWLGVAAYFIFHAVVYGCFVAIVKYKENVKEEVHHGQTS